MADYKEIKGFKWQSVSSDPSNPVLGQVWYNSTSPGTLKYRGQGDASWATGGSMSTARAGNGTSTAGTQTALTTFGGYTPPGANAVNNTEEYDGSSWSGGGALPTAIRNCAGAGAQDSTLSVGGVGNPGEALEYNGSSWSDGGNMSGITNCPGQAFGTQTAALAFDAEESEEYNGTSWTSGGTPSRGKIQGGCAGTQTAGIAFGGEPANTDAEIYNGTSWTAIPDIPANRQNQAGFGTQTAAIGAGGGPPPTGTNACIIYNGSSFSTTANLNTARGQVEGGGTNPAGIICGGYISAPSNATEEFTGAAPVTKSITTS